MIRIDRTLYLAHRLAWFYVHGDWPPLMIDHMNGDRSDNRIENLRAADKRMNSENLRKAMSTSTTGYLGVLVKRDRFEARIGVDGSYVRLGVFLTAAEAHAAYVEAKRRLHAGCTI